MSSTHPAIRSMLNRYDLSSSDSTYEALREILQEIVLLGLYRAGFFDHAVFYGGTALRILYKLDRFSEDLDFSLLKADPDFDLSRYESSILETMHAFGFEVNIDVKQKDSAVKSAFLKGETLKHLLNIEAPQDIIDGFAKGKLVKIKFEVDTNPPGNFQTEAKTLLSPTPFNIRSMTLPSLFAGKMHAILCRNWSSRPKGRDWYDLVWYVSNGYKLDLAHLNERLRQSCGWQKEQGISFPEVIDKTFVLELLKRRIEHLDVDAAKKDVIAFISDHRVLDLWSQEFFNAIADKVEFTNEG